MLYRYIKGPIGPPPPPVSPRSKIALKLPAVSSRNLAKAKRVLPPVLITLGSILIANVAWPIISHELLTAPSIRRDPILSPLQSSTAIQTIGVSSAVESADQPAQVLGETVDYTNAQNWFPTATFEGKRDNYEVPVYKISIPKVDIEDAKVIIGGSDLSLGLIHFPGTSQPGQLGSPVIFGHSTLRQFYSPGLDNPNRYHSIFSKIMTLKTDDPIFIDYDGVRYTYLVKEKVEVKPEDVFILQQRLNNRELKLITCTPEGTYLRRGVIVAQLADVY